MSRAIDKEFEEADDTGVLDISGRNLRQFPVVPGDLVDFSFVFEAGRCGLLGAAVCYPKNRGHNGTWFMPFRCLVGVTGPLFMG